MGTFWGYERAGSAISSHMGAAGLETARFHAEGFF